MTRRAMGVLLLVEAEIRANDADWQGLGDTDEQKIDRIGTPMTWFGKGRKTEQVAKQWHSAILAKARMPEPYRLGWASDTLDGRFQMVTLVTTLVLRQLRSHGKQGQVLADRVYRAVFSGFDHALREEGVGDSSIARRVRAMGEEFFGLAQAVDEALQDGEPDKQLSAVLLRNDVTEAQYCADMTAWLQRLTTELGDLDEATILSGAPGWSDAP